MITNLINRQHVWVIDIFRIQIFGSAVSRIMLGIVLANMFAIYNGVQQFRFRVASLVREESEKEGEKRM